MAVVQFVHKRNNVLGDFGSATDSQTLSMFMISLAVALRNLKTLQDAWHARGHGPPKLDMKLFETILSTVGRQYL